MTTTLSSHLPRVSDLVQGADSSALLLRLKWRMLPSFRSKIGILFGIAMIALAVFIAAQAGYGIKTLAQSPSDTVAQQYALIYLTDFMRGELGTIGAGVLGFSVASALIAPFTGTTVTSFVSKRDLVAVPITRWHQFTDSLLGQAMSSISILQLMALTSITSILTLQGGRNLAMLLTWCVWLLLVLLSVMCSWISELLYKKYGPIARAVILIGLLGTIGLVLFLDPSNGVTLFGAGTAYANLVQTIGVEQSIWVVLQVFAVVLGIGFLLFTVAGTVFSMANTAAEQGSSNEKGKKPWSLSSLADKIPMSKNPDRELAKLLVLSLFRTKESRRPMLASVVIGAVLIFFFGSEEPVITAFSVMIPLVIALAWGTNAFGIMGSSMVWLASQPRLIQKLPRFIFGIQLACTLVIFLIVYLPGILVGSVDTETIPVILLTSLATTVLVARSSAHKSIHRPYQTHFGTRGENPLPMGATLSYTFRFALWQGQYGVIMLVIIEDLTWHLGFTAAALAWSAYRMSRLQESWQDPQVRDKVISTVSQD